jgi:hypothetical protein
MELNRVRSIVSLLQEASRIASSLQFGNYHQAGQAEIDLLSLLFQVQSQVISIRAERCIEQFNAGNSQGNLKTWPYREGADIIQWERRQNKRDRRKLRTYITNDRRMGFADRRKKKAV